MFPYVNRNQYALVPLIFENLKARRQIAPTPRGRALSPSWSLLSDTKGNTSFLFVRKCEASRTLRWEQSPRVVWPHKLSCMPPSRPQTSGKGGGNSTADLRHHRHERPQDATPGDRLPDTLPSWPSASDNVARLHCLRTLVPTTQPWKGPFQARSISSRDLG